jgi:hypothetical protein
MGKEAQGKVSYLYGIGLVGRGKDRKGQDRNGKARRGDALAGPPRDPAGVSLQQSGMDWRGVAPEGWAWCGTVRVY